MAKKFSDIIDNMSEERRQKIKERAEWLLKNMESHQENGGSISDGQSEASGSDSANTPNERLNGNSRKEKDHESR